MLAFKMMTFLGKKMDKVTDLKWRRKPYLLEFDTGERVPLKICCVCKNHEFSITEDERIFCLACDTLHESIEHLS